MHAASGKPYFEVKLLARDPNTKILMLFVCIGCVGVLTVSADKLAARESQRRFYVFTSTSLFPS